MNSLLGALLWSLFLLLSLVLHGKEESRRLAEYRGLCRLAEHLRCALTHAPEPLGAIYERFTDDALARVGFLTLLKEKGLAHAPASGVLHLEGEELAPFHAYAAGLGTRLYTEEKLATEQLLAAVTAHLTQKETTLPVRRKLASTLFFSGGMLLLLLLL